MTQRNSIVTHDLNPRWSSLLSSILSGWNVGLLAATLISTGLGVVLRNFVQISIDSTSLFLIAASSITIGIFLGIVAGRTLFSWFSQRARLSGRIWLIALILLSALSFPAPFSFIAT